MANLLRLSACLFVLLSFNVFAVDTDGDGFSDADETTLGTDPNDPTSPLENKLTASDGAYQDLFGYSVSIDGDTAVIGAVFDDDKGTNSGSAYVYVRTNGVWTEEAKLSASDGDQNDMFGKSVSIDGDTVVIGENSPRGSGYVYVYVRSNGVWSEQAKLTPSDGAYNKNFGSSVSISGDTAVIGAYGDSSYPGDSSTGSAYIFERDNGVWSEQTKLTSSSGVFQFGISVSIDGDTAIIGSIQTQFDQSVYVYLRSNGVWSEQQKLTASDVSQFDKFGYSLSIDGDTAVVGARDDDNGTDSGAAYVYIRSNGVWNLQQKLTASDGSPNDWFGDSVSINNDTIVIGAPDDDDNADNSGTAYVFTRTNEVWIERQKLTASDGDTYDSFGYSVSIDGNNVFVSAIGNYGSGSVYVFPHLYQDTPATITGDTSANIEIGGFGFGTLIATDVDGLTDGSYFSISTPPVNGQALINAATGNWIYTANNSYTGSDPFTVTITDDLGGTTEQVVSITITAPDSDGDGAYDHQDNCPSVSNADQANLDGDTFGDACDNDIDGDGVDNTLDAFPNDSTESSDSDSDNVGDNTDNCINAANFDQSDIDSDTLGDACDADMDGDGHTNAFEVRFGGDETDNNDAAVSLANAMAFSETAPADSDLDGVPDDIETAAGDDTTTSTLQSVIDALSVNKQVPAMSGIGLLALGLSMLGLGAVRLRK
jgi:hypothetical protein